MSPHSLPATREVLGTRSSTGLAMPALQHAEFPRGKTEEISHRVVQDGFKMVLCRQNHRGGGPEIPGSATGRRPVLFLPVLGKEE